MVLKWSLGREFIQVPFINFVYNTDVAVTSVITWEGVRTLIKSPSSDSSQLGTELLPPTPSTLLKDLPTPHNEPHLKYLSI